MKKEWFFDRYCGQQLAALIEDGKLMEFSMEKEDKSVRVGNVYKGRVTNVLSGMNAAFISCGLKKNCYLSMEEAYTDYTKYDGTLKEAHGKQLHLEVGDEVLVQITKPPRGNKGAKVTTNIALVGKHLIYLPTTDFLGISRKISEEATRERLLKKAESMRKDETEGFIVRTQAPLAEEEQLDNEAAYLKNLYCQLQETVKDAPIGTLVYQEEELPLRLMRDSFGDEVVAIHVGDEELYQRLQSLIRLRGDFDENKLIKYMGNRSMLETYGMMAKISEATRPRITLENGGYLVIEHTEAMTVIDVNSGSFTGKNNLEDTVFSVNLMAAREIARQVRLRNIGGIIVVDFIDMASEEHKIAVNDELAACLDKGKAKCNVLPMSELCITQFTRKRLGDETFSSLVKPCPHCDGIGDKEADIFVIMRLRDGILNAVADGFTSVVVDLNEGLMHKILNEKFFAIEANNRWKDKRIYFVPHKTYAEEQFSVRGEKEIPILPEKARKL